MESFYLQLRTAHGVAVRLFVRPGPPPTVGYHADGALTPAEAHGLDRALAGVLPAFDALGEYGLTLLSVAAGTAPGEKE